MASIKEPHARLYRLWYIMVKKCHDPKYRDFKNYGARGITVCKPWKDSFRCFKQWAEQSGYDRFQPNAKNGGGLSLDRINNDGPYSPDNCRWATRKQQAQNRRDTVNVTAWDETKTLSEWKRDPRCAIGVEYIQRRIARGASPEQAISTPRQFPGHRAFKFE